VHPARDGESVAGSIQEIGVHEVDVARSVGDKPPNVIENDFLWDREEATFVHWRNRTVPAKVQATSGRLYRAYRHVLARGGLEVNVAMHSRQRMSRRDDEREALESPNPRARRPVLARLESAFHELLLALSAEHRVGPGLEKDLGVQRGVQAEIAEVRFSIPLAQTLSERKPDAKCGVHRDGYTDEIGASDSGLIEWIQSQVDTLRSNAGTL
jgi:hypothetical protein